jgi:L-cysteine/cystine lyase
MDPAALRSCFPIFASTAFLNAGTTGPVPATAAAAACEEIERGLREGRGKASYERLNELCAQLRADYAGLLGAGADDVALTSCTTEGVNRVVLGLDLQPGDEIVTSDEEHPGLLGPLQAARDLRGADIRMVGWHDVPDAVGPRTRLVAMSHVSWVTGALAPAALAALDVPVVLDGAQGIGAVPVDVRAIGADAYAGSGQKWLCGPVGSGMLYIAPELRERVAVTMRGYGNYAEVGSGLDAPLHATARAHDRLAASTESAAFAAAALETLEAFGWDAIHTRAAEVAGRFAEELATRGREVVARDATTLVSFRSDDAETERDRLAAAGVVVRDLPGQGMVRISAGAWNDESDVERLLAALG